MIQSKRWMIVALFLPLISLVCLSAYKKFRLSTGREVILPIRGYDPRDLLSGHYLQYQVDYGVANLCIGAGFQDRYVCLDNKQVTYDSPSGCEVFIRGNCRNGLFEAGIERYYVPENEAARLEGLVRGNEASVLISVSGGGSAQVKDLFVNGRSWR